MIYGAKERRKYTSSDGQRLPGVTTVLSVLAKPQLIRWSAEVERDLLLRTFNTRFEDEDGEDLHHWVNDIPEHYAYETIRDEATDLGSVIHFNIECFVTGQSPEGLTDKQLADSDPGFNRFVSWWNDSGFRHCLSEHEMIDEDLGVGGTLDILALNQDNARVLIDIKSSKPNRYFPYPEMVAQVAQYERMYREPIGPCYIVRTGKTPDDPGEVFEIPAELRAAGAELFLGAHRAYKAINRVNVEKRRIRK